MPHRALGAALPHLLLDVFYSQEDRDVRQLRGGIVRLEGPKAATEILLRLERTSILDWV